MHIRGIKVLPNRLYTLIFLTLREFGCSRRNNNELHGLMSSTFNFAKTVFS